MYFKENAIASLIAAKLQYTQSVAVVVWQRYGAGFRLGIS